MKTLQQIEDAIRLLQKDNANVPAKDKDLYPKMEAINQALAIISTVASAEILEKRQTALRRAKDGNENQAYQKELAIQYGIIIEDCGYTLPE